MTYVVTEQCIRCRYTDCVTVCPVDCFHAGPDMLVIDPDVCIDCAVCEPACPVDAIKSDGSAAGKQWLLLNDRLAKVWPALTTKSPPLSDADDFAGIEGKFDRFLKSSVALHLADAGT